jgi:hypothetical protein
MEQTRSLQVAAEVTALLRARNALLWCVTREEARVEGYLFEAAAKGGYLARTWDVAQGLCTIAGDEVARGQGTEDIGAAMAFIKARAETRGGEADRGVWIMRDAPG